MPDKRASIDFYRICVSRGFHRIPALELCCIECGEELTPEQVMENERRKLSFMETK